MLTFDKDKIVLMNPVRKNLQLKKHSELSKKDVENELDTLLNISFINNGDFIIANEKVNIWNGNPFPQRVISGKETISDRLFSLWLKTKLFFHNLTTKKISDDDFFNHLRTSMHILNDTELQKMTQVEIENTIVSNYQSLIKKRLHSTKFIISLEQKLINEGKNPPHKKLGRYITEQEMIKFIKKVKAGIALIEIEYFPFEIPLEVQQSIEYADNLKVFDNFYILYSEPNFEMIEEIKKTNTKSIKKDPIVFGVISGSDKLYFIDDWVSDYCKITWEFLKDYDVISAEIESIKNFTKDV